jgi:uncharacterized protein
MEVRPRPTHHLHPFRPAWWLPGAHLQTIAGRYLKQRRHTRLVRERLETPDGDFVDLDHAGLPGPPHDAPLVLVLHGLEGCARSGYVLHTLAALAGHGIRGVALNFRSCSGEPNRTARFYHAGDTADVRHALEVLRARHPGVPMGAVGFSLGGNVLLKLLGESGDAGGALLQGAVAVSVPFDLAAGARKLERGLARVYTRYFLRRLRQKSAAKREQLRSLCDADGAIRARSLREFDDAATAPLHGFRDAAHYYHESSSVRYLAGIRVPTLVLHSVDDPFLPTSAVPRRLIAQNPWLFDGITGQGGHVGFIGGSPWAPRFWAEEQAAAFLAASLQDACGGAACTAPAATIDSQP